MSVRRIHEGLKLNKLSEILYAKEKPDLFSPRYEIMIKAFLHLARQQFLVCSAKHIPGLTKFGCKKIFHRGNVTLPNFACN